LHAVLGWKPLRWIGRRSYGIYLWHWPVYVVTRPGIDLGWSSGPTLVLRLGLTLLLAELSFRHLEEPIRRGALGRLGTRFAAPPLSVVAVGDCVMVDTQNALRAQIPGIYVDALVGRHLRGGISLLRSLRNQHRLGDVVVIHLGTNGAFTSADFDSIMQVLQGIQRVVFINLRVPRRWETPDNR